MSRTLFSSFLVVLGVGSCGHVGYRGDGTLHVRSPSVATDRYVLDLGVTQAGRTYYSIGSLPPTEFVIGFEVATISPEQARQHVSEVEAPVEISLTSGGSDVFRHSKPLRDWIWTCGIGCEGSFAYLRAENDQPGSEFVPRGRSTYRLSVTFPQGLLAGRGVRLIARSGGWK
jgi:hypothetical protein